MHWLVQLSALRGLNHYQGHQMDNHCKDPMGNHHYMHAHDIQHIGCKIHNIEVAHKQDFFMV